MKFVAFWTVEDAGPYKFVRLFRTRARFFVRLLLKEKAADVALSITELLFFSYQRKNFKYFLPKERNLVSLPLEGKETAVGCRMRCSRRRRRFFRMFAPHIPYASS